MPARTVEQAIGKEECSSLQFYNFTNLVFIPWRVDYSFIIAVSLSEVFLWISVEHNN